MKRGEREEGGESGEERGGGREGDKVELKQAYIHRVEELQKIQCLHWEGTQCGGT